MRVDPGPRLSTVLAAVLILGSSVVLSACFLRPAGAEWNCENAMADLGKPRFARDYGDVDWGRYFADEVRIPDEISHLKVGTINCSGSSLEPVSTAVFSDLYEPDVEGGKRVAVLLVGAPGAPEGEWEAALHGNIPGDWHYTRHGTTVLVGWPDKD
jgi:hypothetical protein